MTHDRIPLALVEFTRSIDFGKLGMRSRLSSEHTALAYLPDLAVVDVGRGVWLIPREQVITMAPTPPVVPSAEPVLEVEHERPAQSVARPPRRGGKAQQLGGE